MSGGLVWLGPGLALVRHTYHPSILPLSHCLFPTMAATVGKGKIGESRGDEIFFCGHLSTFYHHLSFVLHPSFILLPTSCYPLPTPLIHPITSFIVTITYCGDWVEWKGAIMYKPNFRRVPPGVAVGEASW